MPVPPELIRKFDALMNRVAENLEDRDYDEPLEYFDPDMAVPLFERWIKIRAELLATEPELDDVPPCVLPTPKHDAREGDFDGRGYIGRAALWRMWKEMKDVSDVLKHPSRKASPVSFGREGVFVGGQSFDAMLAITSIVRAATKSITLVDGYVSEQTLALLSAKADPVVAKMLTFGRSASPTFVGHAKAFNAQYNVGPPLEVRTTAAFHDRFIVVDDADCYHFGASIKDAAKKNAFMFSRLEEPAMVAALKAEIAKQWIAATVVAL
jgi:hypothetical protein